MSSKRLDTLSDFARHHYKLRIECECGRVVLADPHEIILACQKRGLSYKLEAFSARLRCERCGKKPWRVGPGLGQTTGGRLHPASLFVRMRWNQVSVDDCLLMETFGTPGAPRRSEKPERLRRTA